MLTYQYYNFLPGEKKPRNLNIKYTHLNIFTQGIPVASLVGDTYIYIFPVVLININMQNMPVQ